MKVAVQRSSVLLDSLEEHLISGTLLTALIVLLFLKNLRSTIIIAVAIPVSLLGAVAVMYFLGYTFNTMTMLGLLLLIGVVVDDAIVVTFGVLASLFVSMTLTPMLCSRFLKVEKKHGKLYTLIDHGFHAMDTVYARLLNAALNHRRLVAWITLAVVLSSGYFFTHTGSGFMPVQDEGQFMISVKTPLGSSISYTEDKLKEIEKVLEQHKDIAGYFVTIGADQSRQVSKGSFLVRMVPWDERDIAQVDMIQKLRVELAGIAGVQAFPSPLPQVGG